MVEMPAADDVVLPAVLARRAADVPDRPLVDFADGSRWTNAQGWAAACTAGHGLRDLGVRRGDAVAVFLPNGPDFLRAWWGACAIGAVVVPVNLAYRGSMLAHLTALSGCVLVVADEERAARVAEVSSVRCVPPNVLAGPDATAPDSDRPEYPPAGSDPAFPPDGPMPAVPELDPPLRPWDLHVLSMTSGTTGPSKLSRTTYWHTCLGLEHLTLRGFGADDVFLVDLPLFHLGGVYGVMTTLRCGARFALRPMPDLARYWAVARETGATTAVLVSSMISYLLAQPERSGDTDHRLRLVTSIPQPPDGAAFRERFGIAQIATGYGSTEVPACLVRHPDRPEVADSCGQVRAGFEVRLVDAHDEEVPVGAVGEAMVRTEQPWMISQGYHRDAADTVVAWRNGWFHSGDLLRRDPDGNHFFVDRAKDALRRRGENISTCEMEAEVLAHPGVAEAACVGHREAGWIDDEVKVWVVPVPGAEVDPAELLRFCVARMPHFMVPRYLELVDELPKTPTAKVPKYLLRERGNSAATWDREAHGFRVTRDGLLGPP
jgi:crotonobetaine/carnitine-CoA ligase